MKIELITQPDKKDLIYILEWLREEGNLNFYSHVNVAMANDFKNGSFIVYKKDNKAIGFSILRFSTKVVIVDVFCIKQSFRKTKSRIGSAFWGELEKHLGINYAVAYLYCAPEESNLFWENVDFIKHRERKSENSNVNYYKPLIQTLSMCNINDTRNDKNVIEVWDKECISKIEPPTWVWSWNIDSPPLPIIFDCEGNWIIRHTVNGVSKTNCYIKDFNEGKNYFGKFLYIDKL